jgi:hypothetical protein
MKMFYLLLRENDKIVVKRLIMFLANLCELVGNPPLTTVSDVITRPMQLIHRS